MQLSHVFNAEIFILNEGNWMLIGKIGFYNTSQHSHIHTLTARWLVWYVKKRHAVITYRDTEARIVNH